jgi:hypothetical protein
MLHDAQRDLSWRHWSLTRNGIDLWLIADRATPCARNSGTDPLALASMLTGSTSASPKRNGIGRGCKKRFPRFNFDDDGLAQTKRTPESCIVAVPSHCSRARPRPV